MIHTPNSLMMMDGAEKRAVIFFCPDFRRWGTVSKTFPFCLFPGRSGPEIREEGSGHAPRQMEMGFAARGSGSPLAFPRKITRFGKAHPDPRFPPGRKRARKRFFAGSCAITVQRPRPRQKHAHCKLFIIKGNGPSQSPSPPLHREAKEKGAAAARRPTGGFRGKWPAVFPRQPTPEVFPTSRRFPFPAKLP